MNVARLVVGWLAFFVTLVLVTAGDAAESFTTVYLSEFLALNQTGLQDEDGDFSPWIELHNGSSSVVNLAGWFLTDSRSNLTKWRFPKIGILPDKDLLVFASGKNRNDDPVHPHTSFRLAREGNYLALVNRATNIVSELTPAVQTADVSDGRVRGEPALRGYFNRPTPGKPNASAGQGFAPDVKFSRAAGNFVEPFSLELAGETSGAPVTIRFTLDGTLPTSRSPTYLAPISITNTTHVRARAWQEGKLPGPPQSAAYLRLLTNVVGFGSTLPLVILDTFGKDMPLGGADTFVHLSLFEPVNGRTSLTNAPALSTRAGYRIRGSTSAGMPQAGFSVKFLDEFNDDKSRGILGLPADSDWILYAPNSYDPVLIHNPFVHRLSRDMGRYSPRTRFVEVFWVRNAGRVRETHYHGLYVLEEKIKIAHDRVNIDRLGPTDLKPPEVTGGYVLKFDRLGPGEFGLSVSGDRGLVHVEPKEQVITLPQRAPQLEYLRQFLEDFNRVLHGPTWKDPRTGYRTYLDVDAAIDFHVLEVLSGNVDAMVLSTFFYKPRGGKIVCGPHWDFDRALGSTDGRDADPRQWETGPFFGGEWWPRLFRDTDLWQQWVDRWQELRLNHFSETNLHGLIDRLAHELRDAQPRQYQKWGFEPRGGSYQSEINLMKRWLSARVKFIDLQLVAPPSLAREGRAGERGDRLIITVADRSTNTTIYYTLDGSDPRMAQGAVSPRALIYTEPVTLDGDAKVTARVRDLQKRQTGGPPTSTPWSRAVSMNQLRSVFPTQ